MRKHGKQWIVVLTALTLSATVVSQDFLAVGKSSNIVLAEEISEDSEKIQDSDFIIADREARIEEKEEQDRKIAEGQINNYQDIDREPPLSVSEYKNYIPQTFAAFNESKYDPRTDADFELPSIRNQNPLGTCWAHTAMALIEINLAKSGKISSLENMSEFQTVFFMNHDWEDPLGLCSNDNFRTVDSRGSTTLSFDWYKNGGNVGCTQFMLMDWVGAVSEIQYPETEYEILKTKKSSAFLDDSYAIKKDAVHIQNTFVINSQDKDSIKMMIKQYGAVGISYYSYDDYYKIDASGKAECYYDPQHTTTNHAVTIVGWDDDYSKEQFQVTPPENGAWLIRNSWGNNWSDGGYFWISYCDSSLSKEAYALEVYNSNDKGAYYDYNYQYDGGVIAGKGLGYNTADMQEANVFKAVGKEILQAVAVYLEANYNFTIDIYKNPTDPKDITSGTLESSVETTNLEYEGYYTIPLDKTVELNSGDVFAIVVTLHNNNNQSASCVIDSDYRGSWLCSETEALEGQSFIRSGISGTWKDIGLDYGNLRIKAYTVNASTNPITEIDIKESTVTMKAGDTYNLADSDKMSIMPLNHDDAVLYSSSPSAIVTVDTKGLITAKKPGTAIVTAKNRIGDVKDSIQVIVELKVPAESITFSETSLNLLKGEKGKIEATLLPVGTDDYPTWSSSNESIVKVDQEGNVLGIEEGIATIQAITQSGKIAECEVKVSTRTSEEIECNFDKIPKKVYKAYKYHVAASSKMTKLSPTKIEWSSSSSNVQVTPVGTDGKEGCDFYIENVASARNKGEKITITAIVSYIKTSKRGSQIKTKTFKKKTTSYNVSYKIALDQPNISFTQKKESITLKAIFNDGKSDDQPTNTKLKWMITDAAGKKDRAGAKIASVNGKGVVKPKGPGITYVTVYAVDSYVKTSKTYTVLKTIQITCMPVSSIGFSDSSITATPGTTVNVKEKLVFNDGNIAMLPYNKDNMKLSWKSDDKRNVSVNTKGVIKVNKKAAAGSYTITVKAIGGVSKGSTVPEGKIIIVVPAQEG